MSDQLPSRAETADALVQYQGANISVGPVTRTNVLTTFRKVAEAHASGRLFDREAIDIKAAARWTHAEMVLRGPTDLTWEAAYPEEQADHLFLALGAIGAALGDDMTVQELRAAAFDLVAAAIGDTDETT